MYMLTELARSEQLTDAEAHHLLDLALERNSSDLVLELLGRKDLPEDVDERISALPDFRVKSAWLRRTGRSEEQIRRALKGEKRQTVLATLVETADLPDVVYATCTERITGIKALVSLVCGPAPERYRIEGARKLARNRSELTWAGLSQVTKACQGSASIRYELLRGSQDARVVDAALSQATADELDGPARSNVVDVLLLVYLREALSWTRQWAQDRSRVPNGYVIEQMVSHLRRCHTVLAKIGAGPELRERVAVALEAIDAAAGDTAQLASTWQSRPVIPTGSLPEAAQDIREGGATGASELTALGHQLADESTCEEASKVLATLASQPDGTEKSRAVAVQALSENASAKVIAVLLSALPTSSLWSVALKYARPDDLSAARVLLSTAPGATSAKEVFSHFHDSHTLVSWWLAEVRPDAGTCCHVFSPGSAMPEGDVVDLLPGSLVGHSSYHGVSMPVLVPIGKRCFERYGTDPEAWRMIEQLGRGFHGTLGELFSVIDLTLGG